MPYNCCTTYDPLSKPYNWAEWCRRRKLIEHSVVDRCRLSDRRRKNDSELLFAQCHSTYTSKFLNQICVIKWKIVKNFRRFAPSPKDVHA
uniref:Uncharacterized protein n=1 Tax=Romanomermis culicivorax TaxID=13658 RepID=A0A915HWU9_ROMCU